ncbi:THUMP domain-containing class I SAM-dependent RNA methyltransferase [Hespellia stercorisuis]|uniref:Putative N6-adenine-specific DNA methylase n=1 Tax=Hespellia stercorisuis DSM 15480 TaxID=1121950 RepID=A0A1M6NW09_9FIRM|nr:class I SAM-dependent RNA methyltransferase [Hespellia stercorisuis]SHJ99804.1 putative N6-adenine-specific DNA methylase [Hespellia stercorisuis DSM 15480]
MDRIELIAPCHFGLEAILKKEIQDLGYEISIVEDGRVSFYGDVAAICRANVFLRTAERVLLKAGSFKAETFDELFEKTKQIPWETYIPKNGKFWVVKAASVKSKLFSPSDIQSIMKKAMVNRMKDHYHVDWFDEDGAAYPVRVFLKKDVVTVGIDTSGTSLHKRGYRQYQSKAPITETLAAALIMLTPWTKNRILVDPFCGSGTFPIEAAMIAANIAPGMNRSFTAEEWTNYIPKKAWYDAVNEANEKVDMDVDVDIQGYDVDDEVIRAARKNAEAAGVEELIHFQQRAVKDLRHPKKYGFVITNPPYGERLEEKEALPALYAEFGESFRNLDSWSAYMITSFEETERYFGRKADKNRKIYNGMIKTYFYQFMGPKPPRAKKLLEEQVAKS